MNWYCNNDITKSQFNDDAILCAGLNVVLIEPEIAPNAGNISRLCHATGCRLHIIGKMGFETTGAHFKRAAVDYWDKVDISYYKDIDDFYEKTKITQILEDNGSADKDMNNNSCVNSGLGFHNYIYTTTCGKNLYFEYDYKPGDFIIFGPESRGISDDIISANYEHTIRIPLNSKVRSLNLSTSCGIIVMHAIASIYKKLQS